MGETKITMHYPFSIKIGINPTSWDTLCLPSGLTFEWINDGKETKNEKVLVGQTYKVSSDNLVKTMKKKWLKTKIEDWTCNERIWWVFGTKVREIPCKVIYFTDRPKMWMTAVVNDEVYETLNK